MMTDNVTGERFCIKYGCVLFDTLHDSEHEWRRFSKENDTSHRIGASTSLAIHDKGLFTVINLINCDSTERTLTPIMKNTIGRLRTWDSRSKINAPVDRDLRHD